ncbi:glycerol-3-phosphate 1-O-acyltransferase PlsB [Pseudomarimonas arenosa]|uniref:Glycerol-3-phosphate acyltransferase n=1 Tax=Pseudomarimonas arenosa TaxID=2774145 RepID=A0AAW3ZM72_9GAMM|nr:glycerol-3-phosphate 1-O-acyltransferase PlsB [Pseudomarimonas arenosa]MBD8526639.1 glycerol-3-phosphate 1-O-acyltransferase PlsB [Pseudomarimonas arenosa]
MAQRFRGSLVPEDQAEQQPEPASPQRAPAKLTTRVPLWLRWLGKLAEPWLQIRHEPARPDANLIDFNRPVCYVVEHYGVSNYLILERACRELGFPSPLISMQGGDLLGKGRSMVALSRRHGFWLRRPRSRTHSEGIAKLVQAAEVDADLDVQIVPVSIFVGRAPDRNEGWFRVLFSENWTLVGRFRRFLSVILNGRNTIVRFSNPVSLRQVVAEGLPQERTVRKVSRVLRAHFRRIRTAVIGPDLSHRRTLVDGVLDSESVRRAIADQARRDGTGYEAAYNKARAMAMEVAADYSHPVVRSWSFMLTWFWNKLYEGVSVHHLERLKDVAPGNGVIYVPCHRSHIDYLLLSYLLYVNHIVPPHIAAGVNLNLPVVGAILRRGGAFFLRRSFKSNALYSVIFSEYVATLLGRGVSIEYFIEGGRSRTGRLLSPKGGMLAMTLKAFLRQHRRPVVFQPVYIGYEKLMEGKSYLNELSGQPKKSESLGRLLRASFGLLRNRYGQVTVNFGEPIFLEQVLDDVDANWRNALAAPDEKPSWLNTAVDRLAWRIQTHINRAADLNPINLIALSLLATPKHAIAETDLLAQIDLYCDIARSVPFSDRMTVTPLSPAEIIAYGEKVGVLVRTAHPLGDVLAYKDEERVLQSYYRNNVVHLFAAASWVACCFQNNRRMSRAGVARLGQLIFPFVQSELFLPWTPEQFGERIDKVIDVFIRRGLFSFDAEQGYLQRCPGQTDEVFQLRVIAHSLQQAFERYYIAISILVKNGPNTVSAGELETLCHLSAQRLSLLYSQAAPEFFDRSLFRGFIGKMRELRFIWTDESGKLAYDGRLENWAKDAKIILSRELRHSIEKITPETARKSGLQVEEME